MRLLLDTHVFFWARENNPALTEKISDLITDTANEVYISAASLWEIAIKHRLGKLQLSTPIDTFLTQSPFPFLPILPQETLVAGMLPLHHKDPFDRMLVAQAMVHQLAIITRDPDIPKYGIAVLRA